MQWRMVSQHGVQFCVVGAVVARDVERRLDRRMRGVGVSWIEMVSPRLRLPILL